MILFNIFVTIYTKLNFTLVVDIRVIISDLENIEIFREWIFLIILFLFIFFFKVEFSSYHKVSCTNIFTY